MRFGSETVVDPIICGHSDWEKHKNWGVKIGVAYFSNRPIVYKDLTIQNMYGIELI